MPHKQLAHILGWGPRRFSDDEWQALTEIVATETGTSDAGNGPRSLRSVPRSAWDGQDGIRTPPEAPGASEGVA